MTAEKTLQHSVTSMCTYNTLYNQRILGGLIQLREVKHHVRKKLVGHDRTWGDVRYVRNGLREIVKFQLSAKHDVQELQEEFDSVNKLLTLSKVAHADCDPRPIAFVTVIHWYLRQTKG